MSNAMEIAVGIWLGLSLFALTFAAYVNARAKIEKNWRQRQPWYRGILAD